MNCGKLKGSSERVTVELWEIKRKYIGVRIEVKWVKEYRKINTPINIANCRISTKFTARLQYNVININKIHTFLSVQQYVTGWKLLTDRV